MNKKSVVIIGGGISGLSAGVFALQHGYEPTIIEKHTIAGGLCTGWYRNGFLLDGCAHWINGTKPGTLLYKNWTNIGAFTDDDIILLPSWGTVDYQGKKITFWRDLSRAEKEWCEVAPADKRRIHSFFKKVKKISKVELPLNTPAAMLPISAIFKFVISLIPCLYTYFSIMFISRSEYAKKFKTPIMRFAIENIQPGEGNLYSMIFSYSQVSIGNGGLVRGGSLKMVQNIVKKYKSLGGNLITNKEVTSIKIDDNKATGVILKDGSTISGDYVISACDYEHVIKKLLDNKYRVKALEKRFDPVKYPSPSCVLCHFAIKNMIDINPPYSFDCEPFKLGHEIIDHITIRPFNFDKETFCKNNAVVVQVLLDQASSNYLSYWNILKNNNVEYNRKKQQILNLVRSRIEIQFPELVGNIENLDIATPYTFYRYTYTSNGAFMSQIFSKDHFIMNYNGKVKGLKNFYMAGQWMSTPGGLPLALSTGKFAIQRIAKFEKMKIRY